MFGTAAFDPAKERGGPSIDEQVGALAGLIKAGKIRHYGLSNETAWGVCEFRRVARETLGDPQLALPHDAATQASNCPFARLAQVGLQPAEGHLDRVMSGEYLGK